jgi:hypothetical protein
LNQKANSITNHKIAYRCNFTPEEAPKPLVFIISGILGSIDPAQVIDHFLGLLVAEASTLAEHPINGGLPLLACFPSHLNGSKGMAFCATLLDQLLRRWLLPSTCSQNDSQA